MLSNLSYTKKSKIIQYELIKRKHRINEMLKKNDGLSITNSLNISKKIGENKTYDINKTISDSKEKIIKNETMYDISELNNVINNKTYDINKTISDSKEKIIKNETMYDISELHNVINNKTYDINKTIYDSKEKIIKNETMYDISELNNVINNKINIPHFNNNISTKINLKEIISEPNLNNIINENYEINNDNKISIPKINNNINRKINIQQLLPEPRVNNINKKTTCHIPEINNVINNKISIKLDDFKVYNYASMFPYDVNTLYKKGIKIINNVYQSKYNNNQINCTGLGDFIRGCYFILEFCEKYNFQYKIVFNNCISKFLQIKTRNLELIEDELKRISFFKKTNIESLNIQNDVIVEPIKDNKHIMSDFIDYVNDSPVYYGNVFVFCNSFPINDVLEKSKSVMRKILEPTIEMKQLINKTLFELDLIFQNYITIHIRSGDSYLKKEKNNFDMKYITQLVNSIGNDIITHNERKENKYLIISDNNDIKIILKNQFPIFKMQLKDITHFGEGILLEEYKVINTLIDFYLLSYSKKIRSYTCYEHGSGFSWWCAKTYNIPYICKLIKV